ncbi:hypothetical protein C367_05859 [Cryptococcus neoformans Ze90-1]|nr:hypothetical protein C367_05859 [Cryptococcus neoformans var. grubii Ze90-1]
MFIEVLPIQRELY